MSSSAWADRQIDRIFERLTVRWGYRFLSQYAGVDLDAVKADWRRVLAWYLEDQERAKAIGWAIENLPDEPIMAPAFKRLCQAMPATAFVALPEPKPDPARVAAALDGLRQARAKQDPLDWARRLRERHMAGERLSHAQRTAYEHALRHELAMTAPAGEEVQ